MLTNLQLLHYARDGLITNIGINTGNRDAAEDLVEWREHLTEVERRIALCEARAREEKRKQGERRERQL